MDALQRQAREAIEGLGERGRTQRIPDEVRQAVMAYARRERSRGRRWSEIAAAVGLSTSVLGRWSRGQRWARSRVVRVAVSGQSVDAQAALVLVTPAGYRLEGLDAAKALDLLRALG